MDLESRSHQIRHYRDYTGTQSLSFYQEAEGRGGCGLWGNAFLFTTVATYLAIWLANLPLPIRVQTTLLASMCHAQKIQFLWRWHCVKSKSNVEFSVVYTFMENGMRHHSGQKVVDNVLPLRWPQQFSRVNWPIFRHMDRHMNLTYAMLTRRA